MTTTAKLTLEQFLALPETEPAGEFVDGEVWQKPMPEGNHGLLQLLLGQLIGNFLDEHPIAEAATEWRCIFGPPDQERALVPDVAVVDLKRLTYPRPFRGAFQGAPDLAIEIRSPEQSMSRILSKTQFYQLNGVRLIWVVDPDEFTVTTMRPGQPTRTLHECDTLDGEDVLPGFQVTVERLFAKVRKYS